MKVSGKFIRIIKALYENIEFYVRTDTTEERTEFINQNRGVRQGCNLSPILFNLYDMLDEKMNDTHSPTIGNNEIHVLQFADDLVITSLTPTGLQKKIDRIVEYCNKWDLHINATKTKILIGRNEKKHGKNEYWYIENKKKLK